MRALEERDIPGVVDLHRRGLLPAAAGRPVDDHSYFKEMFLGSPWSDNQPSLVYEDADGKTIGFLGIMARRMTLRGRPIHASVTAHFIVEPARRATLAGIELLRALLAGPQDLTLADEASDTSRRLMEGLGGTTELLYSLYWARVLRPGEFAVWGWGKDRRNGALARPLVPRFVDAVATRWPGGPFRVPVPQTRGEELDGETLAACIAEFTRSRALRPAYDGRAAAWLLQVLSRKPGCGTLRKVLVRTAAGEIAGWYLYCGHRGGVGEVLQVGAREQRVGDVLDHLFAHAWRDGMVALAGRIDPQLVDAFSARGCFFHHRGHWTLVHSRDPELVQAIRRGDAFLTRLEGEWCLRF